ncbi:MAG: hypothetical protein ABUT20_33195, partial [Bacteroidota bacterium]
MNPFKLKIGTSAFIFLVFPLFLFFAAPTQAADVPPGSLNVPVVYYKLANGLKVVLSQDKTAPTIVLGVYY